MIVFWKAVGLSDTVKYLCCSCSLGTHSPRRSVHAQVYAELDAAVALGTLGRSVSSSVGGRVWPGENASVNVVRISPYLFGCRDGSFDTCVWNGGFHAAVIWEPVTTK